MIYTLYFTDDAKKDLDGIKKNEPVAVKKAKALLTNYSSIPRHDL